MTGSKIQNIDLFKAAMGNPEYLTAINKNTASQAHFLTTLKKGCLTLPEIIDSIQIVQNSSVKSLLIIYLLSQKEYLDSLKGTSLLHRLTIRDNHTPSRLNALIHQLDLKILTNAMINELEPEAAVSILCSVPHFHLLTREQTEALIGRYAKHELIVYWMNHFATMPNAHYLLAHLMKLAGTNIIDELSKIEPNQKEAMIINIIEHFELFHYIPQRFLEHANKESHLILAIRLYLNGHYNKALATYINQLTKKLLEKNHSFSPSAIELLFFLNDKLAFKELANKTAFLTNRYLRTNAQEGNIALFYQNNQLNLQRMVQNINLNPVVPESFKEQNKQLGGADESPFISGLIKRNKSINCFEYFLIHYQGSSESISKLLHDYMEYYHHSDNFKSRSQAIHHLGFMLTRPELETTVKEAIFTTFLNYPSFFDEQISYQLFLFDAKRIIRYFGLRGGKENYQRVVDLCTLALKNLNSEKNPEIIQIAQKALSEARLELSFTKEQGFFSGVIKLIKRCWTYGWTGLFKPNLPEYVAPESWTLEESPKKSPRKHVKKLLSINEPEKDLLILLNKINLPLTQEKFEDIMKALDIYSLQTMPKNELETRKKLHNLYHYVIRKKEENPALFRWLNENQNPFVMNQLRLLEIMIKEKSRDEVNFLLTQINEDSDQLRYISEELNCVMPELVVTPIPKLIKNAQTSDFVKSTTKVLSEYVNEASEYAQTAWQLAGCFLAKIGNPPKEEDDSFKVEHVPTFSTSVTH
ncbi:Dot/Icm T4SS effector [Legionella gratiana]|uniref:Dot/Icm T4SS effector n=1 Tax=Legionella gratiana TaxID=45066 RepID=A0A378JE20_9GAMM|nr:hypothetical protein [Legionella gratiana]KTD15117.1 Dot/Icm T4SS effector [Legionella gratiana]STX46124.1 Dot/Icm secretion system substrate [Legionella gratiana]